MSTTVTYKGETLTTVSNQIKTLQTAGKYLEGDVILTDVSQAQPLLETVTRAYTPTESAQTEIITPTSGYDGIGEADITVGAIPSNYASWWGGVKYELIGNVEWSAAISEADNWPLTPTTSAQNLTWVTDYTATANANATIDRIGKGYHGVTETLDFGTYNYVYFEDCFVHYEYTSPEASLGKVHTIYDGFTYVSHYGARPRLASGAIIRPSATTYGAYGSCLFSSSLIGYRTAAGTFQLANNSTYGVGVAGIAPSMNSTSTVKPSYFNVRTPSVTIRAHNTYMVVGAFSNLDMDKTKVYFRCRVYRVPVEYGAYTVMNDRLLDMLQGGVIPEDL